MGDQFKPSDDKSGGSSGPPAPLTPEQLALLPHDDAGSKVVAILWTVTAVATVFLALRLYCKIASRRGLWWDDYFLLGSWICLLVDCSCWTVAVVKYQFGLHSWDMPPQNLIPLIPVMSAAGSFILTSIIWSKTSFGITLLRLAKGWMKTVVIICIVATNVSLGLSALFNYVSCTPVQKSWNPTIPGTCWDSKKLVNYHLFSGAVSAFVDIALSLLPWPLLWGLQMKRREKIGVGLAMSMGIFAGVTSIIKTVMIPTMATGDLQQVTVIVYWGAAEAAVTIVAASIPVLRVLVRTIKTSGRGYSGSKERSTSYPTGVGKSIFATATATTTDKGKASKSTENHSETSILDKSNGQVMVAMEVLVTHEDKKTGGMTGRYKMAEVV